MTSIYDEHSWLEQVRFAKPFGKETKVASVTVSVIGSFVTRRIPEDLPLLFQGGIAIDPRNDTPMEMDAYSIYLALKALERTSGRDYSTERTALVEAVVGQMQICGGFWSHGAWTGSRREVHMRFTAAAIRLLAEALEDGLVNDPELIVDALERHLSFSERLSCGLWFLHDTLETEWAGVAHPHKPRRNKAWSSSEKNCLVLNTHMDTLSTLLHVMRRVPMRDQDKVRFQLLVREGLHSLKAVLMPSVSLRWRTFAAVDSIIRSVVFASYIGRLPRSRHLERKVLKVLRIGILGAYFSLRRAIRSHIPAFAFPDGYLERDISLMGASFEYHVVNAYDLARLMTQAREYGLAVDDGLFDRCDELIDAAINYAIGSSYWKYHLATTSETTRAILLCEAILLRASSLEPSGIPKGWIKAYCAIRRVLPPSAAILGYDPFIVAGASPNLLPPDRCDLIRLRSGKTLMIDLETAEISLPSGSPVDRFHGLIPATQ
ncbi:MAG: hypothetical protein KGJ79_11245 [Alphaproteobacteria bacterium]|nr:hypothetical protein [Alphaproteobacteria bacterium]MDE2496158.1 hypothetical protein [Alphaproteobacteria bacterium]